MNLYSSNVVYTLYTSPCVASVSVTTSRLLHRNIGRDTFRKTSIYYYCFFFEKQKTWVRRDRRRLGHVVYPALLVKTDGPRDIGLVLFLLLSLFPAFIINPNHLLLLHPILGIRQKLLWQYWTNKKEYEKEP